MSSISRRARRRCDGRLEIEIYFDGSIDYFMVLRNFERLVCRRALRLGGNRQRAADLLGIGRSTFVSMLRRLGE